jgi:GH15 family glucan-1,4-alpha-glucosidase
MSMRFMRPERIPAPGADDDGLVTSAAGVDARADGTIAWWRRWSARCQLEPPLRAPALRSAMVLRSLIDPRTGALVAAPTTSLPEDPGGRRNWDYRYSWVRDSSFAVRALGDLGFEAEADRFRRFVERSAAGSASELQVLYGVGGERWVPELTLGLAGYAGSRPVRVGNRAARQFQLDIYGEIMDLAWQWHRRGGSPQPDYQRFLMGVVDQVLDRWTEPDRGMWEVRGDPQHFVHSKAMCWVTVDRGIALARDLQLDVPVERWIEQRDRIRERVETDGYDRSRGVFRRAFGDRELDAALLLLPAYGFVAYDDPRMVRTTDAIRDQLDRDGLILRYRSDDGLSGPEGAFVACTFWLATCLAAQGRLDEAHDAFERASATANDVGLFAEEFDHTAGVQLGNFPQALTHLAHIGAATALSRARGS